MCVCGPFTPSILHIWRFVIVKREQTRLQDVDRGHSYDVVKVSLAPRLTLTSLELVDHVGLGKAKSDRAG